MKIKTKNTRTKWNRKHPKTTAQRRKIYALCEELGWNDNPKRIHGFVKRVTHVERLEWLNNEQCEKVIEGLKAILKREKEAKNKDGKKAETT